VSPLHLSRSRGVGEDRGLADVSVRPARATDAEAAARAQLASWAETGRSTRVLAAASVSELAEAWTEAIVRPPSPRHRVSWPSTADVVVGVAATAPHDDRDADPRDEGALMTLTVAPVARAAVTGRGCSRRGRHAAEAGFDTAYAWVPDERGLDFLVQAGWAEDGARRPSTSTGPGTVLAEEIRLVTDVRPGRDAPSGWPLRHDRRNVERRVDNDSATSRTRRVVDRRGSWHVRRLVRRTRCHQRSERPADVHPVGARLHRRQPVRVRGHRGSRRSPWSGRRPLSCSGSETCCTACGSALSWMPGHPCASSSPPSSSSTRRQRWLSATKTPPSLVPHGLAFWATGLAVYVLWNLATLVGALGATALGDPKTFGLDAAVGAAFLALLWPRVQKPSACRRRAGRCGGGAAPDTVRDARRPVLVAGLVAVAVGLRAPSRVLATQTAAGSS